MATLWLRMARAAAHLPAEARAAKLATAEFYFDELLPEIETVLTVIERTVAQVR